MQNDERLKATVAIVKTYLEHHSVTPAELADLIEAIGLTLVAKEREHAARAAPPRTQTVDLNTRSYALRHHRRTRHTPLVVTRH